MAVKGNRENNRDGSGASDSVRYHDGPSDAKVMVCPNCGASFSVHEPRCPYCGALNPTGAEEAYMDRLGEIKDSTAQLAEDAQREINANVSHTARRVIVIMLVTLAAVLGILAIQSAIDSNDERQAIQSYEERERFRERHFEKLDALYASGDDAELNAYAHELLDEEGSDALYSWRHYAYLEAYNDYESLIQMNELLEDSPGNIDDYTWMALLAIDLGQYEQIKQEYAEFSEEETARLAPYRNYAHEYLHTLLGMNDDEVSAFVDDAKDSSGYVQEDKLERSLESRLRQLGIIN